MGTLELEPKPVVPISVSKFWEQVKTVLVPVRKIKEPVWLVLVSVSSFRGGYLEPLTPS